MNEESIWVMDFKNQLIGEKVMKPANFDNYTNGVPDGAFFKSELKVFDEYKKHLASRRTFSYHVSKEQDGKELIEGKDFKFEYQQFLNRMLAIPIDNIGETKNKNMKSGIELIAEERQRQINIEGWTAEHDAEHEDQELLDAAICYASAGYIDNRPPEEDRWSWLRKWWKPSDNKVRNLVKSGALIAAEIDRLQNKKP